MTMMADTPMPITGFTLGLAMSEDGQTTVAILTLETGELTFEFAINEDGARALAGNLEQFVAMAGSRGGRAN
jgi:hypothetical protein